MRAMVRHNIGRLPVVSREDPQKMVGYFNRGCLLTAWSRQAEEESVRESGWLHRWRKPKI
jgi:chloride channel protein, CIC family